MKFLSIASLALIAPALGGCPSGYSNLRIDVQNGSGNIAQYSTGVNAAIKTLEYAYCKINSKSNVHKIVLNSKFMNDPSSSSITGGSADTPACSRYREGSVYKVDLDNSRTETQGMAWSIMLHEVTHTLATPHTGNAYMVSGQIPSYQYIDRPVINVLGCIGIKFRTEIESQVMRGRAEWTDIAKAATGLTYAQLQGMGRGAGGGSISPPPASYPPAGNPPASYPPATYPPAATNPPAGGGSVNCGPGNGFAYSCGSCRWCAGECARYNGICKYTGSSSSGGGSSSGGSSCGAKNDRRFDSWCKSVRCSNLDYCSFGSSSWKTEGVDCRVVVLGEGAADTWATVANFEDVDEATLKADNPDAQLAEDGFFARGTTLNVCSKETSGAAQVSSVLACGLALFTAAMLR